VTWTASACSGCEAQARRRQRFTTPSAAFVGKYDTRLGRCRRSVVSFQPTACSRCAAGARTRVGAEKAPAVRCVLGAVGGWDQHAACMARPTCCAPAVAPRRGSRDLSLASKWANESAAAESTPAVSDCSGFTGVRRYRSVTAAAQGTHAAAQGAYIAELSPAVGCGFGLDLPRGDVRFAPAFPTPEDVCNETNDWMAGF